MAIYLSTFHKGTGCLSGSVGTSLLAPFIVVARMLCSDRKKVCRQARVSDAAECFIGGRGARQAVCGYFRHG